MEKALEYGGRDLVDEAILDACALRLMAMLDTLGQLPVDSLYEMFGDDWNLMRGVRNRIVHGYATVDPDVIAETMRSEPPAVRDTIRARLASI